MRFKDIKAGYPYGVLEATEYYAGELLEVVAIENKRFLLVSYKGSKPLRFLLR